MPSVTATVTAVHEVKLKPTVKRKLLTEMKVYAELKSQRDAIDSAMKKHRESVEGLLVETGETSLDIDGHKATFVSPVRSKLDPKKLIEQGVTTAQIEAATVTVPGKSYVKITAPGQKEEE